jgi:hypothetical protein
MPSGTRSLMLNFGQGAQTTEPVLAGAVIRRVDGRELIPGEVDIPVTLEFWTSDARDLAIPGAKFAVWYGRPVGDGVVEKPGT